MEIQKFAAATVYSSGVLAITGMQSLPAIIYFYVPEYSSFCFFTRPEMLVIKPFLFQLAPEAFHWRVVPAVTFTAHRTSKFILFQEFLVLMTAVLTTPIRVYKNSCRIAPPALACFRHRMTSSLVIRSPIAHPTISCPHKSNIPAKYSHPSSVGI